MDTTRATIDQRERFALIKRQWERGGRTLDEADLRNHCLLDNGRHAPKPTASLGLLARLPTELLDPILLDLDVLSLTTFRRVNQRAMLAVDSLVPYAAVLEHCPDVLRAVLAIQARHFSLGFLHDTLRATACETCSEFGSYLYLITCRRVCWYCFMHNPSFLPMRTFNAAFCTSLPQDEILRRVPHITTLPGSYKSRQSEKTQMRLLDRDAVHALWNPPASTYRPETRDLKIYDPRRYRAIISAPRLDPAADDADWGCYCTSDACRDRRRYTRDGYARHLLDHGEIELVNGEAVHVRNNTNTVAA